jgi:hypothetical protein
MMLPRGPTVRDGLEEIAAGAVDLGERDEGAAEIVPPETIDPVPPGGVHHYRAGEKFKKPFPDPLPASIDPHVFTHPGSVFASFTDRLLPCLRDPLRLLLNGQPQVPVGEWQRGVCQTRDGKPVALEIAWDAVGDASLYWRFLGLDGPPKR